jgi:hypothetical protein
MEKSPIRGCLGLNPYYAQGGVKNRLVARVDERKVRSFLPFEAVQEKHQKGYPTDKIRSTNKGHTLKNSILDVCVGKPTDFIQDWVRSFLQAFKTAVGSLFSSALQGGFDQSKTNFYELERFLN